LHLKEKIYSGYLIPVLFVLSVTLIRCDHGIAPPTEEQADTGVITGTITYQNWPDLATVKNLKIVVFKSFPPGDILEEVVSGSATVYPPELNNSLPKGVDSTTYMFELDAGIYDYVVVAQQYGGLYDWRAVGQYDITPQDSLPSAIRIYPNTTLNEINIRVDFDHLPIQPF
jgi:hypothetical protein